ncbi:MAG: phenylalanine--tRNA ligase subunit beta [Luteolibacter sp.]
MNISLNWLSTHLDLSQRTVQEIDDLLTFAGIEVEGIRATGVSTDKIVVAQIVEAVQHPNADKLKVTQVDCGEGQLRQIVCGAKNYQVGDKVPCCLPGAELPAGFTIGETKMRGVESRGMLAAAEEIGLPKGEDGLLILPADARIGQPVKELFDSDVLLEVEVTPNRPDLLSHRGLARELAALLKAPLKESNHSAQAGQAIPSEPSQTIRIEAHDACPFYSAIRISGVQVVESPAWLRERLESIGLRPINAVVDVTNFVLHELGQPLHAFDAAKIKGEIVVRKASMNESFVALDGSSHSLCEEDLVVADTAGAVLALAGVMGGLNSGVTESSSEIILESAYFTPRGIRQTSRRSQIASDSSYRFERGVDPQGVLTAARLAVRLIQEICGGQAAVVFEVAGALPPDLPLVQLNSAKLDQLMGAAISHAEADEILQRLGLEKLAEGEWKIPSYRADLQRHIDLVEEVARVHGLANVPSSTRGCFVPTSSVDAAYDADMVIRRRLAALGLYECQTIKLIADEQVADALPLRPLQDGDVIRVKSPLSEDHAVMRPSLIPGLLAAAIRNNHHQQKSIRLFELGRVFRNSAGGKAKDQEAESLSILVCGPLAPLAWDQAGRDADVFDLKGLIQALVPNAAIRFFPRERDGFALACDIKSNGVHLGVCARLGPAKERGYDFAAPVYLAEIDLGKLRKLLAGISHVLDLPQFPGSSRDAAMEIDVSTPNTEIEKVLLDHAEPLLESFECFDVFSDPSGQKLAADRKSLAYRFHYRDPARTMKAEDVDRAHAALLAALQERAGVKFR